MGVSIVIPFLNEEDGILDFCRAVDDYCRTVDFPVELVFVDDGSTDSSVERLRTVRFQFVFQFKLIQLSKNFGSHAAIRAGLTQCHFDTCAWMGADLQDPMEFIELGYQKIREGYNAVYFEKKEIKISPFERMFSKGYSLLMRKFAVKNYASNGVNNIIFDGKIKRFLNENIESNSAIHLQIMDAGFRYTYIPLIYHNRQSGKSKWNFSKKVKLFIDSFVAFSFFPIRMVSAVGILLFLLGIAFGGAIVIHKLLNPTLPLPGYPTLACLVSVGFGITNISLGIIAEYLWRAYDCARNRPVFIISEAETFSAADQKELGN